MYNNYLKNPINYIFYNLEPTKSKSLVYLFIPIFFQIGMRLLNLRDFLNDVSSIEVKMFGGGIGVNLNTTRPSSN